MEIALFTDTFAQLNGVATHVKNLAVELSRLGHEVTVYTSTGTSGAYNVINLPHFAFPFEKHYKIIIPKKIEADFDVAHVHTVYFAGRMGLKSGRPSVGTTHTLPKHMFSAAGANFLEPLGWRYLASFYNRCDAVISQADATYRMFRKHGMRKRAEIISAGIDTRLLRKAKPERFREKYGIDGDFVLLAGRIDDEKRPEMVLSACRELDIPVVLAGDGQLRKELEKEYPEARFLGSLSYSDVADAFSAARAFALASTDETEGLAALEAMAAGTPVVYRGIPILEEKVGKNGIVFSGDGELKSALSRLFESKALCKKLSARGKKAAQKYDIRKCTKKIVSVYEKVSKK